MHFCLLSGDLKRQNGGIEMQNVMKIILCIILPLLAVAVGACFFLPQSNAAPEKSLQTALAEHKILIVYYSRAGSNYVSGDIVNLPVGNTAAVAELIRQKTGADVFEIKTVKSYPADYTETTEVAKKELQQNARPEITGSVPDIAKYDTIILGYPNWWGTMPMAVFTFLEKHDLSGKTVLPLCTHEGSAMGRSVKDLKKALPSSIIKKGLPIKGTRVYKKDATIEAEVENWLKENL